MRALLIPVKRFALAKQRLTDQFSPEVRAALADALWQDFFDVVSATQGLDRIFVISIEPRVLDRARALGWKPIPESQQVSESDSVDFASALCEQHGVDSLLRLPVDLPLIEPRDIQSLFDHAAAAPSAVIVRSRDGQGTNALLRTPPTLFRSHFGPGSFAKHRAAASEAGARVSFVRNPRIEVDLDDAADLAQLSRVEIRGARTRAWLAANTAAPAQPTHARVSA